MPRSDARRFLAVGWKRLARRMWLARRPTSPKLMTGREFLAAVAAAGITFRDDFIEDLNETSGVRITTLEERRAAVTLPPPHAEETGR